MSDDEFQADGYVYRLFPNWWAHTETGATILDEDMPEEVRAERERWTQERVERRMRGTR